MKMKHFLQPPHIIPVALVAFAVATTAVSGAATDCPNGRASLLTFNAGLTPTVAPVEERRRNILEAFGNQSEPVDYMCLQEVWYEKDMKTVLDAVEAEYPYHYSALHSDVSQLRPSEPQTVFGNIARRTRNVPCKLWNKLTLAFLWCLYGCQRKPIAAATLCRVKTCLPRLYALSQDCRSCLIMSKGNAVSGLLRNCFDIRERYNRFNRPGLLILSKQPLSGTQYVAFHQGKKVLVERGYIRAKVGNNPEYICTHMTAYSPVYFSRGLPQFTSNEEKQFAEIHEIADRFSGSPHVLLGDVNTGPARNLSGSPELTAEYPANYELLVNALGYRDPYLLADGRCTYCTHENPLLQRIPNVDGILLDHVFTRDVSVDLDSVKRVLDSSNKPMSDHYGIQMDICLP